MMYRRTLALLLAFVILAGLCPVRSYAAEEPAIQFSVMSDVAEARPGDAITYTLTLKTDKNISGMQFYLDVPIGLTYVADSFAFDSDLKDLLNNDNDELGDVDWTDHKKMVIINTAALEGLNNLGGGVTIGTFQCTADADASGSVAVGLIFETVDDGDVVPYPESAYGTVTTAVAINADAESEGQNAEEANVGMNPYLLALGAVVVLVLIGIMRRRKK